VVTILLAEWELTCDYFDGDWLNGPVPRLFALDPAAAKAAIDLDPNKAFKDIQRIHARMAISEHVSPEDAWDFVGNPRYTTFQNNFKKIPHTIYKYVKQLLSCIQNFSGLATSSSLTSAPLTRPRRLRSLTARPHPPATTSKKTRPATPPPRRGSGHRRTPAVPPLPPRVRFVQTLHSMAFTHIPLAFSLVYR
jgi:hypothetical protein